MVGYGPRLASKALAGASLVLNAGPLLLLALPYRNVWEWPPMMTSMSATCSKQV